jgi:glycine dehydrogenase subunit 2
VLTHPEPLLFELDHGTHDRASDWPVPATVIPRLGTRARTVPLPLPNLSEPQVVRHYTRISQKNYSIDGGFYPLGSCTMKHNPRLNEKLARLPGFADIHPLQPLETVPGALALMQELAHWLATLTGLPAVCLQPAAGAHGELCGMITIKAACAARGEQRSVVLVPESAHGTNPATAAACGFTVQSIPATPDGHIDTAAFLAALSPAVAGAMITNPNTCGLFEPEIRTLADALHGVGGFLYGDGANFNAIMGRVRPADLGFDCMHINLHKTFSTPHGGGGPGSGPVVFSEALARYAPRPLFLVDGTLEAPEDSAPGAPPTEALGRMKAFYGQFATFVRALAYMQRMGADGLFQGAGDAVLAANYMLARLTASSATAGSAAAGAVFTAPYPGPCMHECLLDDRSLKGSGVSVLDLAKALLDEGFHPMTMYFPLVVSGAMLIEPTETESKATLDAFVVAMQRLLGAALAGEAERFKQAPRSTPVRRLDETRAARSPRLRWQG